MAYDLLFGQGCEERRQRARLVIQGKEVDDGGIFPKGQLNEPDPVGGGVQARRLGVESNRTGPARDCGHYRFQTGRGAHEGNGADPRNHRGVPFHPHGDRSTGLVLFEETSIPNTRNPRNLSRLVIRIGAIL